MKCDTEIPNQLSWWLLLCLVTVRDALFYLLYVGEKIDPQTTNILNLNIQPAVFVSLWYQLASYSSLFWSGLFFLADQEMYFWMHPDQQNSSFGPVGHEP